MFPHSPITIEYFVAFAIVLQIAYAFFQEFAYALYYILHIHFSNVCICIILHSLYENILFHQLPIFQIFSSNQNILPLYIVYEQ